MVVDKTKGINNLTLWYIYKHFLIWNQNNNVQSRDLPVLIVPVLPNDLLLPSLFYPLLLIVGIDMKNNGYQIFCT